MHQKISEYVTPRVGVWIETIDEAFGNFALESLPAWECGLKQDLLMNTMVGCTVTPRVGVWIETK